MAKARTIYVVTDDDTQTAHATAVEAIRRFCGGTWKVTPPAYPAARIPVTRRNLTTLVNVLELEGYLEFDNGVTRINSVQFYED